MNIYVIIVEPEASRASLYPAAFKSLEEAQQALKKWGDSLEQKSDTCFRSAAYTYFTIVRLEVKE